MQKIEIPSPFQRDLLLSGLCRFFGDVKEGMLEHILPNLEWLALDAGEVLFEEGSLGADIFFVVSGRLRATVRGDDESHMVRPDIARGEVIGERAFLSGSPRSARVTALRASVLARFSFPVFEQLILEYPSLAINLMRMMLDRLKRSERTYSGSDRSVSHPGPGNITIVAITPGLNVSNLATELSRTLKRWGKPLLLTEAAVRSQIGKDWFAVGPESDSAGHLAFSRWFDEMEAKYDYVLLLADATETRWSRYCMNRADEILMVADTDDLPSRATQFCLKSVNDRSVTTVTRRLLLLHSQNTSTPARTAKWLDAAAPVTSHVHVRHASQSDLHRLARILSGNAIGLVLSGGGARGLAHLGAYRALTEAGIEIDMIGGTSMGAAIGSLVAQGLSPSDAIDACRSLLRNRPLTDYNMIPMVSIIRGRKLEARLLDLYRQLDGHQLNIEDTWRTFFCVAASYSHAREAIYWRGPLAKIVRASVSIPAFLPPVYYNEEALIDGGVFNNFPVDVMARGGAGVVIGVDLRRQTFGPVAGDRPPGTLQLLWRKVLGKRSGSSRTPSLAGLLYTVPTLASAARQARAAEQVDVLIRPDLTGIRPLDWSAMDRAIDLGYLAAQNEIERQERTNPTLLSVLRVP